MFLLRPRPYDDESMSSWRQRTGFANGFWRFPTPNSNRSSTDPDRLPSLDEQNWLSDQFAIDHKTIAELSLEARVAQFQIRDVFTPRLRWILMLGQQSECGPMFCPECLRTDERAYFRAHWRYAFLTECPVHQLSLLDRCPQCEQFIWPTVVKSLPKQRPWHNLTECPHCRFDLRSSLTEMVNTVSVSSQLWRMLTNSEVTREFPSVPTLPAFFDGLWALCQLLLRRSGQQLLELIPMKLFDEQRKPGTESALVEGLSICHRRNIVAGAYWLMEQWPERFLSIAKVSGITKATFIPTSAANPPWLTETLDAELARHNKHITTIDVSQAVKTLRDEGRSVSKKAVRQLLQVSESKVISSMLSRRNHARPDELIILLNKFEHRLSVTAASRGQKSTLLRDYLIFILSILTKRPIGEICALSANDVAQLISESSHSTSMNLELENSLRGRAKALNSEYAAYIRPKFLGSNSPTDLWFIGREGKCFAGHSLRERIAKLMRTDFADDLWHSCDAFTHSLGIPPLGRRLQRQQLLNITHSELESP